MPGLPVPDKYVRTVESLPQVGLNGRTSQFQTGAVVGGGTVVNGESIFPMSLVRDEPFSKLLIS